jgi:hypothetical protein
VNKKLSGTKDRDSEQGNWRSGGQPKQSLDGLLPAGALLLLLLLLDQRLVPDGRLLLWSTVTYK